MTKSVKKQGNPPKQHPQRQQSVSIQHTQMYSGKMPPPTMLREFEEIHPGFTDRLFTLVEEESKSKRRNDMQFLENMQVASTLAILSAFFSVALVCAVAAYALSKGYSLAATSIMTVCVGAVVVGFLQKSKRNK